MDFSDWIGRGIARDDIATPRLLNEFRATLRPFLFQPDEISCPPGFHFGLAPATPGNADTGEDGAEAKGLFLPPIAQRNRMWAGGSIETVRPIRAGQSVTRVTTIEKITEKQGASGSLVLVSLRHDIRDEEGLMVRERQDLVFRDGGPASPAGPDKDLPQAGWQVEASALMLFRFSAFTFNGHRIHYDQTYAAAEGYPGLLVHGPLQATLMLNLLAVKFGTVPRCFDYRCRAPLFAPSRFAVCFAMVDGQATARIVRGDGVTTAEASVRAPGTG